MFDLGWTELLVIGAVAIIVVGPKDLPKLMRAVGQFSQQLRRMAFEFRSALDDATNVDEITNIKKDLQGLSNFQADPTWGSGVDVVGAKKLDGTEPKVQDQQNEARANDQVKRPESEDKKS